MPSRSGVTVSPEGDASETASPPAPTGAKRWRGRRLLIGGSVWVTLILLLGLGYLGDRVSSRDKVLRGVEVKGVPLAGLDRAALERALAGVAERLRGQRLTLRCAEQVCTLAPADVGFETDTGRTVEAALAAGRSGAYAQDFAWWVARWFSQVSLTPIARLDRPRLTRWFMQQNQRLEHRPLAGALRFVDGQLTVEYPRRGRIIDPQGAERLILAALVQPPPGTLELPLTEADPELDRQAMDRARERAVQLLADPVALSSEDPPAHLRFEPGELGAALTTRIATGTRSELVLGLDPDKLAAKLGELKPLEHAPRDARFEVTPRNEVRIIPSEPGLRLDPAAVAQAVLEASLAPARSGKLVWDRSASPALTTEQAEKLGVTRLVAVFETRHPCCQPRVKNIHRIADLLHGTLVAPGETFSVNQAVGPRTAAKGFVPAPTIEEGEMVDTLGGGISQFATTLFNAVFYAGYEIVERQPHTYYFSRYPMGHEATLSYPKPDLVFRNDTQAGLLLWCEYDEKSIRVKLFGDPAGRRATIKVSSRFDVKQPPVHLVANRRIRPDREDVTNPGTAGWSVMVTREVTLPDGSKKEDRRKVTYSPHPREVELHPCRIPEGEPGYTGEPCPVPQDTGAEDAEASESERSPETKESSEPGG
jgi:vancomycin resistance protein YoaR